MFENLRTRLAISLLSGEQKANARNLYNVFSRLTPGMPVYTDMSVAKATREGYKLSVFVYRAIRTYVQAASGIPWIVVNNETGEPIPNHEFTKVWANPNPEFSGQDNMEFIIAHLKLGGNALIQPLMVSGKPREFWICMPDLIQPIPSKTPGIWIDGYQVQETEGRWHTVPAETFIHFMQFNPGNPYWGIGDLQASARTVDCDNEAQDTQKVSMQNRGTPDGVFVNESIASKEQWDEAVRQVKEQYLPKDNRRAPWVIGGSTKWYQMSLTPVEMDYILSRVQNLRAIATAFGLDPWWLGDREHSSYNNILEAKKALYETCAIPLLDDIKATLNLKIAPLYGENITITYDLSNVTALRDDFGQKVDQAQKLWQMGIPMKQINTLLKMGLEEFDGWERGYLPFSVAPVGTGGTIEQPEVEPTDEEPESGSKSDDAAEKYKTQYWKRIDSRRVAYWGLLQKKIEPLYETLGNAVAGDPDAADQTIKKQKPAWEKTIKAVSQVLIDDFGKQAEQQLKARPGAGEFKFDPATAAIKVWVARHAAESVKTILDTQIESMRTLIAKGVEDGLSTPQIAKVIRQFYTDNASFLAMRVARTETAMSAGYGQSEAARQMGADSRRWLSSRDDRVRSDHQAMDGETVGINDKYSNGMSFVGDPAGGPENIINCILPDNSIRVSGLLAASRASYEGTALELITEKGNRITITPNHPILTDRGFVFAQQLRPDDNLICDNFQEGMVRVNKNITNIPTTIEQIFSSLNSLLAHSKSVGSTVFDFHGDGRFIDGDINIVVVNRKLGGAFESPLFKPACNDSLCDMNILPGSLFGNSPLDTFSRSAFHASDSSVSSGSAGSALLRSHEGHRHNIGLADISRFDTSFDKTPSDYSPIYSDLSRQFLLRFASLITTDKVVDIRDFNYSGHVYDLQSLLGLYTCNGIFVKNCRCVEQFSKQ